MSDIVPFGKYRGQPIEMMQADRGYMQWLEAQPWVREQFPALLQIINVQQTELSNTPEHNRLQNMFLDNEFAWNFMDIMLNTNQREFVKSQCEKENEPYHEPKLTVKFEVPAITDYIKVSNGRFHDVCLYYFDRYKPDYYIEIKPIVGDDYPNVLRQIKQNHTFTFKGRTHYVDENNKVLLLEEYNGVSATKEQFMKIFEMDNIKVVFLNDVMEKKSDH